MPRPVRRVLVVDDNEDAADMLCDYLTSAGIEARAAYDADGAWSAASALHPDVVVVDIELPGEAGDHLARRMRDAGIARSFVAMTGHSGRVAKQLVEQGEFDAYVAKPCRLQDIDALLGVGAKNDRPKRSAVDGDPVARPSARSGDPAEADGRRDR